MRNLLAADFARLWRSKSLWISAGFLAIFSARIVLNLWEEARDYDLHASLESRFFTYALLIGLLIAVICPLLLGPEHTAGLRNKTVLGYSRAAVYLSALLTCAAASIILCASAILPGLAIGILLSSGFKMPVPLAVLMILGTLLLSLVWSALFTLIPMLIPNRAVTSTAAILLSLGLLLWGMNCNGMLEQPPTTQAYTITVNGEATPADPVPNPDYLSEGPVREMVQFQADCLPGGQAYQYWVANTERLPRKMAASAVLFVGIGAAGLLFFRRRDLK